jgi:hypothetical protein
MSDVTQAQRQNLNLIADAPPTQPQGLLEAPTLQQVRFEADFLSPVVGEQGVRELCAHFGAESADDLAETDWAEFIRLAKMRAEVLGRKRTTPSTIAVQPNGKTTTMRNQAVERAREGFRVLPVKPGSKAPGMPAK